MKKLHLLILVPTMLALFSCNTNDEGGGEEGGYDEDLPYEVTLPSANTIFENIGNKYSIVAKNITKNITYKSINTEDGHLTSNQVGEGTEEKSFYYEGMRYYHNNDDGGYVGYYYNSAYNESFTSDSVTGLLVQYTGRLKYSSKEENVTVSSRSCTKYNTVNNSTGKPIEVYIDNNTNATLKYVEQGADTIEVTSIDISYTGNLNGEIGEIDVPANLFNDKYGNFALSSGVNLSSYTYQNGSVIHQNYDSDGTEVNWYSLSYNVGSDSTAFDTICQNFFNVGAKYIFEYSEGFIAEDKYQDLKISDDKFVARTVESSNQVARFEISRSGDPVKNINFVTVNAYKALPSQI